MRLEGIQIEDIVEVHRLGRRFHALVTSNAAGGLSIQPPPPGLCAAESQLESRLHSIRRASLDRVRQVLQAEFPISPSLEIGG
jgi:hypothetical protein